VKELVYGRLFSQALEQYADDLAFHDRDRHSTFETHGERVLRLADTLRRELGVEPDDRVALFALNGADFIEVAHACLLGAGTVTPINVRHSPPEVRHILADSQATVAFVDARVAEPFAAAIAADRADLPLRHVVLIGDADIGHDFRYADLLAAGEPRWPAEPEESGPAMLAYTGGTTGRPKGVLCSQRAQTLNVYRTRLAQGLGTNRGRVYLQHAPMFHTTGMIGVLCSYAYGVESVILPFFKPDVAMTTIEEFNVGETVMVPTMIAMVFAHPEFAPQRLATLRKLGYGASPMPVPMLRRLLDHYPELELLQGFGMTESSGAVTVLNPEDHHREPRLLSSVGRAVPGVQLRIVDPDGRGLPTGEVGELCIRGGSLMDGYWQQPALTGEAFRDGWYHTGDAGWLDEQGYLFLVDRVDDMIITGAENVYSLEVERAIETHPAVAQVAVIGVPDAIWGEQVHAIVVPRPGSSLDEQEVRSHLRGVISDYKIPKSVEIRLEQLPTSAAMKPLKHQLRAQHENLTE
jgi:acyl-CoA synthetase (AMP-forming)/AMP-acid ligase II